MTFPIEDQRPVRPQLFQSIAIDRLAVHPANSNVIAPALFEKLRSHLQQSGRYPPIIVRPMGNHDAYQLIDGHHRVMALRQLGDQAVNCVIWEVNDDETLILMATLNRLAGQDDPYKRAHLIGQLHDSCELKSLDQLLPEQTKQLSDLLSLHKTPKPPRPPQGLDQMPAAVHFFLLSW